MVRTLLVRGMLVGILAGLLTFAFARVYGEPQVDRAIAFEAALDEAKATHAEAHAMRRQEEPELVSRQTQAGLGLFTGVMVYCVAFGGLFALVFAVADRRIAPIGHRGTALLLAGLGFIAVYLVPNLKYPANPPSVGDPDTIGVRTALYFLMILISVFAMVGALALRRRLAATRDGWNAAIAAGAVYLLGVALAAFLLPPINEVPDAFPAVLLWRFRIAALGMQAVMWATQGLAFGLATERALAAYRPGGTRRLTVAAP